MPELFGQWTPRTVLQRLINRDLPADRRITLHVGWPLYFLPWLVVLQLIDPSPIWVTLTIGLAGFYAAGIAWMRSQARSVHLSRQRLGTVLVAGDSLQESFTLHNESPFPLLWAAVEDDSFLPGYNPSQVVSCGGQSSHRWTANALCQQRGIFRLGPHRLHSGDPFGLLRLHIEEGDSDTLVVYPRVAHLPPIDLPRGQAAGRDRRRRLVNGAVRAPTVREYQPGDSLRHIHWPTTARQGDLMVAELEEEPSGDLWIALDLNQAVHKGKGEQSTLEYSVVLAASLAAELLGQGARRSVGLVAVGTTVPDRLSDGDRAQGGASRPQAVALPPQPGQGQMWRILAALAPLQAGDLPAASLLNRYRSQLGKGHTLVLITPQTGDRAEEWIAELLSLRRAGVDSSVMLVTPADGGEKSDVLSELLARHEIPVHFLQAGTPLKPALTYRRTRTVLRTTPTGGVVAREVEEEVG